MHTVWWFLFRIEVVLFLLSGGSELQMIQKISLTVLSIALQRPQREGRTLYIVNGLLSKPKKVTRSLFTTQPDYTDYSEK